LDGDCGVVDQDVELAEFSYDLLDHGLGGGRIRLIASDRESANAFGPHHLGDGLGFIGRSSVGDSNIGSLIGERRRQHGAKAPRATRDDSDFAVQNFRHRRFLSEI
jgi:hypothetical protein